MKINRAQWEVFLIFFGVISYLFLFSHNTGGDGYVRYLALTRLIEEGKVSAMVYSYVGPLISAPLYWLGKLIKSSQWWVSRFNVFVLFFTVWFFGKNLKSFWSKEQIRTFILLLFCATMFPKHSTDYYSEVFSACFVAIAIFLFLQNRFYSGAVMLCLSVWNTPGTAVAGALLLTVFAYREWRLRYLSVIFFLALGIVVENYVKYGVFFPHEYLVVKGDVSLLPYSGRPGFSYPMFFGVISVLLSPGKGLLFYMPPLVFLLTATLWLKEGITKQIIFYGSFYLLGLVLLYSRWWAWHGDWFWGPRFFLFASILASFILIQIWQTEKTSLTIKVICFVAALVSFWVGAQGIMYGQDFLDDCYRRPIGVDFMCHYVPEYSPLWRFFIVLPLITGRRVAYAIYFVLVAITVLWNPGREILRDFSILIKNEWKEKFGKKGMIRW